MAEDGIEGVGGSEIVPDDAGIGKVNPRPLSEKIPRPRSGLLMAIAGKVGFAPEVCAGNSFAGLELNELDNVETFCPLLCC